MKRFALLLLIALTPASAQPVHELCAPCHASQVEDFQTHIHFEKGLSCDACHGTSKAHREATGHKPPDRIAGPAEQPGLCGACHQVQAKSYQTSKHWQLVEARTRVRSAACTTCHGTHSLRRPASLVAQCQRCHTALPAACSEEPKQKTAKVSCANCHDKHTLVASN